MSDTAMRYLSPDKFDIGLIIEGRLRPCPLCADRLPAIINRVNDGSKIFRTLISCSKCGCQVGYNDRDLDVARNGAIVRWNTRPVAAPTAQDRGERNGKHTEMAPRTN